MIRCCPQSAGTGVVSVDWWALQCKHSDRGLFESPILPLGLSWFPLKQTNVWRLRGYILDDVGNKIATVLAQPHSGQIDQQSVLIEIANRYLYREDFRDVTEMILDACDCSAYGLNRVDLCCDFEMSYTMWKAFAALDRGDAYVKNIRLGNVWHRWVRSHRVPYDMNWGSMESTFRWKVYYKYLELQEAKPEAKKPYINALWRQFGMDERNVWRCEVSVHKSNGVRFLNNEHVPIWDWYEDRVRLFSGLYSDKFVVRRNEGHVDKRNDTELPFLQIEGTRLLRSALPKDSASSSDAERRLTCKLWKELQNEDTQANAFARGLVVDALRELLQLEGNVWVLQRVYGVAVADIERALC